MKFIQTESQCSKLSKASKGHSSVEIVNHKLDSGVLSLVPAVRPLNLCVALVLAPSTVAWSRQMAPEPLLDPGSWLQSLGLSRANGCRAFAWPRLLAPESLPDQ